MIIGLNERSLVVGRSINAEALAFFDVGQDVANLLISLPLTVGLRLTAPYVVRLFAATAAMSVVVAWARSDLAAPDDTLVLATRLTQCVPVGVLASCATQCLSWDASSRQTGPEQQTVILLLPLMTSSRGSAA
jgi:hypothetical protein